MPSTAIATVTKMMESLPELVQDQVERKVSYTFHMNRQSIVVENVLARVNAETGEQLFSTEMLERLKQMILQQGTPRRTNQVPVHKHI